MICPYCGEIIVEPNKEHFFPQMIYPNEWDFYACRECNRLKGQHIVYPKGSLFRLLPSELSLKKFTYLWKVSGNIKYLNILPVAKMKDIFEERKWSYEPYLFSIDERKFYGLDRLKEIYTFYVTNINTRPGALALVMSSQYSHIYFIHEYSHTIYSPFPEVRPIAIKDFLEAHVQGWLMYGTTRNGIWKTVQSYTDYFERLLSAPSCMEMLQYNYK